MINATDIARSRHSDAITAVHQWATTNKQRAEMAETIKEGPLGTDDEKQKMFAAYMQLCEIEMVQGGAAVVALTQCMAACNTAYQEQTGEELLMSVPGDTQGHGD